MSFRKAFDGAFATVAGTNRATAPHGDATGRRDAPALLAVGTLQWGTTWIDDKIINPGGCIAESTARDVFYRANKANVRLWDTAEGYGGGTSEKRLGRLIGTQAKQKEKQADASASIGNDAGTTTSTTTAAAAAVDDKNGVIVMTKFLPVPWRYSHACFENAVRNSCERLGVNCIHVYLLHSPIHWRPLEFWIEAAAICKRKGLIEALGLSNCNSEQVVRAVEAGRKYGVDVVLNQVHYSLLCFNSAALQRMQETCRQNNVTVVGFSPIGQGLLTNKLTAESFQHNRPAKMMKIQWNDLQSLRSTLHRIAERHRVTMARVALKWCIQHHVIPLVGCRKLSQLDDSLGCLDDDLVLSEDDMKDLDEVALNRSTFDGPPWRRAIFVSLFGIVMIVCRILDTLGFGMIQQASA